MINSEVITLAKWYNENDFISWVNHYLKYCNFDLITIYDNMSSINLTEIINRYFKLYSNRIKIELVTDEYLISKVDPQVYIFQKSHNEAIANYQFFIDYDEYIWLRKDKYKNINSFLQTLEKHNIYVYLMPEQFISYESQKAPENRTNAMINDCYYTREEYLNNEKILTCSKVIVNKKVPGRFTSVHFFKSNDYKAYTSLNDIDDEKIQYMCSVNMVNADIKYFHYHHRSLSEWFMKLKQLDMTNTQKTSYDTYNSINPDLTKYPDNQYYSFIDPFNTYNK